MTKRTASLNMAAAFGGASSAALQISAGELETLHGPDWPVGYRAGFFVSSVQSHSRHWRGLIAQISYRVMCPFPLLAHFTRSISDIPMAEQRLMIAMRIWISAT